MLSIALNIIAVILILVIIDALWMLFVLYRAFVKALESILEGGVRLPLRSKWSIIVTVIAIYEEMIFEDLLDTLITMPLYSFSEPDLGAELFSAPFLNMMRDGVIDLETSEADKE